MYLVFTVNSGARFHHGNKLVIKFSVFRLCHVNKRLQMYVCVHWLTFMVPDFFMSNPIVIIMYTTCYDRFMSSSISLIVTHLSWQIMNFFNIFLIGGGCGCSTDCLPRLTRTPSFYYITWYYRYFQCINKFWWIRIGIIYFNSKYLITTSCLTCSTLLVMDAI